MKTLKNKDFIAGAILTLCASASLLIANLPWGRGYVALWEHRLLDHPLSHWVNDVLMAVFFLLVGLELKREVLAGELRSLRRAMLPVGAALGGMAVPAALYLSVCGATPAAAGFGIPMSTDIAFVIGVVALLGKRVPPSLKVFLTALAVADDIGAIVVIALFYTSDFKAAWLLAAVAVLGVLLLCNRVLDVNRRWPYAFGGVALWLCVASSGVHAGIAGVMLAAVVPFRDGGDKTPARVWERRLHIPVYYAVLPLFVLCNTAMTLSPQSLLLLAEPHSVGIMAGLLVGKPAGIVAGTALAAALGGGTLPPPLSWRHILAGGFLGGIGFTMAIFITLLSFDSPSVVASAKLAVLVASSAAAVFGSCLLLVADTRRRRSAP